MKTLVLANQKGGVGKSAIGTQLAFYAHMQLGLRVLYIDFDHQRNSTDPIVRSKLATLASFTSSELLTLAQPPRLTGSFALVAGDEQLSGIERQPAKHNDFANHLAALLETNAPNFDLCLIDTNPNPDIRYGAALVVADYVLSPIQLNQEALDGIAGLLGHPRFGIGKIKQALNARLELIGILPNIVEGTPFQKENFMQLATRHAKLLIELAPGSRTYAAISKRTAIAEAQAAGVPLFTVKKTSARDAWNEARPAFDAVLQRMGWEATRGA